MSIVFNSASGAAGIVYVSSLYVFNKNPTLDFLVLVYLIFQLVYVNDRYKGLGKDTATNAHRTKHINTYAKQIPIVLLIAFFLIIIINLIFSNISSLSFSFFIILSGFLYPIYFKDLTKKIYMFKNIYVSLVFVLIVLFPPIYYVDQLTNINLLYFFLIFVFLESLFNQIVLDTKDIKLDKKQGLLTLPVLIGMTRTILILWIFSLLSVLLYIYLATSFGFHAVVFYLIFTSLLINLIVAFKIKNASKISYIMAASKFFFWFFIVFILK